MASSTTTIVLDAGALIGVERATASMEQAVRDADRASVTLVVPAPASATSGATAQTAAATA